MADLTQTSAGHATDIPNQVHWFWGKLNWDIFPFYDPLILGTFIITVLLGVGIVGYVTYKRLWGYLWTEWFTSVDHKKIGIMYMILATVMLIRGFSDAVIMRAHQALASAGIVELLPGYHYDQVFTAHGVIMIFFVAMPFITGFMNYIMPLQIGARDVAFPFLNNFSFWLTFSGVILIMLSLFVGEFAATGWLAFPPLSGLEFSPGGLLPSVVTNRGHWDDPFRDQPDRHDRENACAGYVMDETADLYVVDFSDEHLDRRLFPGFDCNARAAHSR